MIVAGAKPAEARRLLVRLPVAVGVAQVAQLGFFAEVTAPRIAVNFEAGWDHQAPSKDRGFIRPAVQGPGLQRMTT